jgi:hypothetical protein
MFASVVLCLVTAELGMLQSMGARIWLSVRNVWWIILLQLSTFLRPLCDTDGVERENLIFSFPKQNLLQHFRLNRNVFFSLLSL